MRKFLLLALFAALAYVANMYYTTGQLPLAPTRTLTEAEQNLQQLKEDFLKLHDDYFEEVAVPSSGEPLTPELALTATDKIAQKLELLLPNINSEYGKAQAGWLSMKIRKFKKKVEFDQVK